MSTINDKTSPNQMRILMERMRKGNFDNNSVSEAPKKDLTMRDMLKLTRKKINESDENSEDSETADITIIPADQRSEEEKFRNRFKDMIVDVSFNELEKIGNAIVFGGTIDGVIQFIYKVTPDESTRGVEFKYLPEYSVDNPDNQEIVKRIQSYFDDTFYPYWRDNALNN